MNNKSITAASLSIFRKGLCIPGWLWRKTWRYSLALLIAAIVVHTILNVIAGRQLDAELQAIRAAGQPVLPTEIEPPIPDEENAAALYLYVFRKETGPIDTKQLLNSKEWVRRGSGFFLTGEEMPILDRFRYENTTSKTESKRQSIADVKAIFARHQREIQLLQTASHMPSCRFPMNWQDGWGAHYPHFAGLRNITRLFTTKALVDAKSGDSAAAVDDLITAVRIIDHFCVGSIMLDELIRSSCFHYIASVFPLVITAAPPSESQARAFYNALGKVDSKESFTRAMAGERCAGITGFDTARKKGPEFFMNVTEDSAIHWRTLQRSWPLVRYIVEPFIRFDEVGYLRHMKQEVELTRKPYFEAAAEYQRLDAEKQSPKVSLSEIPIDSYDSPQMKKISQVVLPRSLAQFAARREEGAAVRELMRIAMVLSAYRIKHGYYPETLPELRALGWSIAPDPFTGKDFMYRRGGKGYLLYSLGPDSKNNNGVSYSMAFQQAQSSGQSTENIAYDIPVRMPPTIP